MTLRLLLWSSYILADREFNTSESAGMMQARLHIQAFTKGKDQLNAAEIEENRTIAKIGIQVKQVIAMVQQKHSILQDIIPINFIIIRKGEDITLLKRIVCVCCAHTNICNPIVTID